MRSFKSATTVEYGRLVKSGPRPRYDKILWQRSFHDRILRDDRALENARAYIKGNPDRWLEKLNKCQ